MNILISWLKCENGATALEYGMIAAGIALVIVAAIFIVGEDIALVFNYMKDTVNSTAAGI